MKLYSKPGACSTADHIALQWTGQPFEVELLNKDTLKGPEFLKINPAGAVPALVDGDFVLLQNAAIMGYIADSFPQAGLGGDGSPRQLAATGWRSSIPTCTRPSRRCSRRASSLPTKASTTRSRRRAQAPAWPVRDRRQAAGRQALAGRLPLRRPVLLHHPALVPAPRSTCRAWTIWRHRRAWTPMPACRPLKAEAGLIMTRGQSRSWRTG